MNGSEATAETLSGLDETKRPFLELRAFHAVAWDASTPLHKTCLSHWKVLTGYQATIVCVGKCEGMALDGNRVMNESARGPLPYKRVCGPTGERTDDKAVIVDAMFALVTQQSTGSSSKKFSSTSAVWWFISVVRCAIAMRHATGPKALFACYRD